MREANAVSVSFGGNQPPLSKFRAAFRAAALRQFAQQVAALQTARLEIIARVVDGAVPAFRELAFDGLPTLGTGPWLGLAFIPQLPRLEPRDQCLGRITLPFCRLLR